MGQVREGSPGSEPAPCQPAEWALRMDGLTDEEERARTREEDRPHQCGRKRNRHEGSFKSHAGKQVAEEVIRGGSQQTG